MGKVYLSQFNFENYKGAENINLQLGYIPEVPYLENYALAGNNGFFLSQDEPGEYNYTLSTENAEDSTIFLNQNLSRMCKDLTNLYQTDLTNKTLFNYKYATNMHTSFANCFRLFQEPISAKYIKSMYGTYYNDTNIYGVAAVNANVINMIGTYYNCGNLITSNCRPNVSVMVDSYHDCWNITGRPACGDNVKSLYNAYYNCFNLLGAPANCNSALVTINAYYNCPNLYGDFYWYKNDSPYADEINATNMFYNRDCSSWLNIFVYPNKAIFNAFVNYSATYGNLYGVGALEWTKTGGMYGFNNYVNDLYKTKIVEYFSPINISSYSFNNTIIYSSSSSSSTYRYNCIINTYGGLYNSIDELPPMDCTSEGYVGTLNTAYGVNIYKRWINISDRIYDSYYHNYTYYNLYYGINYIIINNQDPERICWQSCPSIKTVNDFDYVGCFNLETYVTHLERLYDTYSYKNNQIVIAQCSDKVENMIESYFLVLSDSVRPYNNGKEIPYWLWINLSNENSPFYHILPETWDSQTIYPASNISIRPACGNNVINMINTYRNWTIDTEPVCGPNVENMYYTYENCRGITEPACGDNVTMMFKTYCNTDVKNPYFGPNVTNAYAAYGYTNVTTKNLILPNTISNVVCTYRNCNGIKNIENLDFNGINYVHGCFLGCPNLTINSDTNIMYAESFKSIAYLFYNCWSITDIMPFPHDRFACPNMSYTYAGCNHLINLRENNFTSNNFNGAFAWCSNLQTGTDKIYFTNNTKDINFIFAMDWQITDDINWILPENHYMNMEGCFQYCYNINYINIIQNAQLGCMIGGGMFAYCTNLKNINFYPSFQSGTIYANYDHLFDHCYLLEYIIGVNNFDGSRASYKRDSGSSSSNININQTMLENNCFSFERGAGGYSFAECRNLKIMPNFIRGGYFGNNTFERCSNILQINFRDGSYTFYGSHHITGCANLLNITFDNVSAIYFNDCTHFRNHEWWEESAVTQNLIIQNTAKTYITLNNSYALFTNCEKLNYLFECNPIDYNYEYEEGQYELYPDLFPLFFYLNNCEFASSGNEYSSILFNNCINIKDLANCPYFLSIYRYPNVVTYANCTFQKYCNNLRGLKINANHFFGNLFYKGASLMNLRYFHFEEDEGLGYTNRDYVVKYSDDFQIFNKQTFTQTQLDYCYLGIYNRWTGNYVNYEDNSDARRNKRSSFKRLLLPNLFSSTDFTSINMLYIDDKFAGSWLTNTHYDFNGAMQFGELTSSQHFFNAIFKNTLRQITTINSLILSPQQVSSRPGIVSFEILNIFNSRAVEDAQYWDSPYNKYVNNFLPLTTIHCNFIYICPHMNTFISAGTNFTTNYLTPTKYSDYNFADVITNTGVSDVSLILGIDIHQKIEDIQSPLFTHQKHTVDVNPSMVKMNYNGQQYDIYTIGTFGAHIAYLGSSHAYTKYFGDMTFTESKVKIGEIPESKNIYKYQYAGGPPITVLRTNDIATDFNFTPFGSVSFTNLFNTIKGWNYDQTLSNVASKNYTINLYEVDLYNASRNIHIKYIEEELNFID